MDVRGRAADDGTPARHERGEGEHIGARTVEDGVHLGVLAELLPHHLAEALGVLVFTVGDLVALVGLGQSRQHLGVHAGVVVARETAAGGVVESCHDPILPHPPRFRG